MPKEGFLGSSTLPFIFNQSPYGTRFLAWCHHAQSMPWPDEEDPRIDWGTRLERPILEGAAEALHCRIEPNEGERFVEHDDKDLRLGATVDAFTIEHENGPGIVEAKNVDYWIYRNQWTDRAAPMHIELQLQTQLMVTGKPWGAIAALVGGNDLKIYERKANEKVFEQIREQCRTFWDSVRLNDPPDPVGDAVEIPALAYLYPEADPEKVVDASADFSAHEAIVLYRYAKDQESFAKKLGEKMKARILALAEDAAIVRAHGFRAEIKKSPVDALLVALPEPIKDGLADGDVEAIDAAIKWEHVARKAHVRQLIKVVEVEDGPVPPEWEKLGNPFA